ncbi:MAG: cyclopropane-fatty-acyl-phospholipid synthase [Candidatus Yonathbacteria bacterium RIFCSPHIGHO2_01_FULL_51_10]|uniref:Cyclopropane-fatty-acyl-phospholipid synthase n=1 Tax=Candidatus Yonathbacteria bacterium RIFCSPHIGHO2_01_FULL_51_10 TaxID=1802723 RepID=A0A1G2SB61_9BACT|nr:MAG: cyclopropane-fatty-acyl-phospholipid synthase [Candidatus Yonathbacteria bacterium RIFCSPHIGHO2_01_FULL_51_10]
MAMFKERIQKDLAEIDIQIGGTRPWDIQVHDERLYRQVILRGSIGLGEAYMDGWWDCAQLDEFFNRILRAQLHVKHKAIGQDVFHILSNTLFNKQSPARSFVVGERHYDIGNDLYKAMLDKRMVYTCGYWGGNPPAGGLDEAQEHKLDLVCRKLNLQKGQRVLDIGCGWGSFAKFAAERYGVHVTGLTISKEQAALAREMTKGLPVEVLFQDYREVQGTFDHIVSLGMFEHVGHKNYRTYMEVAAKHLKDDGLFLLHTIGGNRSGIDADPWIDKYIFPNGILPRVAHIGEATSELFVMEDWHNFGAYYDTTLMAWNDNVEAHWGELKGTYSERFHRMWNYYLLSCAGAFRARDIQLWQIVLSKGGLHGGYTSIR